MRRRLIALRTAMAEFGQDFDFGHGETDGYAEHLTRDPLPGTPRHSILITVSFGDHQVTNWASEIEARTIGARLRAPVLDPGRYPGPTPYWGHPTDPVVPVHGPRGDGRRRPRPVAPVSERRLYRLRGLARRPCRLTTIPTTTRATWPGGMAPEGDFAPRGPEGSKLRDAGHRGIKTVLDMMP